MKESKKALADAAKEIASLKVIKGNLTGNATDRDLANALFEKSALEEKMRKMGRQLQILLEDNDSIFHALQSCYQDGTIDKDDLPAEVVSLCDRFESLQRQYKDLKGEVLPLQQQRDELNLQLKQVQTNLGASEQQGKNYIRKLEQENLELSEDYQELKKQLQKKKEELNRFVYSADESVPGSMDRSLLAERSDTKSRSALQSPSHNSSKRDRSILSERGDINGSNIPGPKSMTTPLPSEKKRGASSVTKTARSSMKKARTLFSVTKTKKTPAPAPGLGDGGVSNGDVEGAQECTQS